MADSSSGSYRRPAIADTRMPGIDEDAHDRGVATVHERRAEQVFRSRASSSSAKNALAFLVTFGASTRSIGFGFSRSPSLASHPKNTRMLRKWTAADAADVRFSSASRNARMCGASTSSTEAGMPWSARNRHSARTESVYERTVRELLAAASSASCHEAMNVLSAGPDGRSSAPRPAAPRFAHAGHGRVRRLTWVPPGHRCEPRPPCPTLDGYAWPVMGDESDALSTLCLCGIVA